MERFQRRLRRSPSILLLSFVAGLSACGKATTGAEPEGVVDNTTPLGTTPLPSSALSLDVIAASGAECPAGGSVLVRFVDANGNATLDANENVVSRLPICNGARGTDGGEGIASGLLFENATSASCAYGGSKLTAFADRNGNGQREIGEEIRSETTICNGRDGADGRDGEAASLSVAPASAAQCPGGGAVYTSVSASSSAQTTVVCNGQDGRDGRNGQDGSNGQDGTNGRDGSNGRDGVDGRDATYAMGAVGSIVKGRDYSACHHDYLYLPNREEGARGWLLFRHQANGANDQGVGPTGFQVWNVDIGDFALVSEVGGVTYCRLRWHAEKRLLEYEVVDRSNGLAGETGQISF